MRESIAIKLILGLGLLLALTGGSPPGTLAVYIESLGLLLALFFVAAGMSFWQSNAIDQMTENIVSILEPKMAAAHEMEHSLMEIEM